MFEMLSPYLLAPALVAGPRDLGALTRTLFTIAEVMIWVDAHLLAGRELEHVLVLVLILRRTAHITTISRAHDHRLAVVNTVVGSVTKTGARGFAR